MSSQPKVITPQISFIAECDKCFTVFSYTYSSVKLVKAGSSKCGQLWKRGLDCPTCGFFHRHELSIKGKPEMANSENTVNLAPNVGKWLGDVNLDLTPSADNVYAEQQSTLSIDVAEPETEKLDGLSFGSASEHMQAGKAIARQGWNGKGIFVYYVPAASYPAQTGVAKTFFGESGLVPYNAYMAIKNVDNTVSTWAPSGNDALAQDWYVVDLEKTGSL